MGDILSSITETETPSTSEQPSPEPSPDPVPDRREIICKHYKSSCTQVCASCSEVFPYKYCHDECVTSHQFDRSTVKRIICDNCGTDQSVSIMCVKCETVFGKYFCDICNIFEHRDISYYHCYHCGICQKGSPDEFFHCMKCDSCLSLDGFDTHRCVENSNATNCPICLEDTQTNNTSTVVLLCGHSMHTACHQRLQQAAHEPKCPVCRQAL